MRNLLVHLTTRWSDGECKRINRLLAKGGFPTELPTVKHDGVEYLDLRGFPLCSSILAGIKNVDFSHSNFEAGSIHPHEKVVEDCLFLGANLSTTIGYRVRGCDFAGSSMKRADLRGEFLDCNFTKVDLRHAHVDAGTVFKNCDFRKADLWGAAMNEVVFDSCYWSQAKFGGSACLVDAKFIGSRPNEEQLGDAMLWVDEAEREAERQAVAEVEAVFRSNKRRKPHSR